MQMRLGRSISWLDRPGGLRLGETPSMRKCQITEIERLEKLLGSGELNSEQAIELVMRRICELKGLHFDSYEPPDD